MPLPLKHDLGAGRSLHQRRYRLLLALRRPRILRRGRKSRSRLRRRIHAPQAQRLTTAAGRVLAMVIASVP